MKKKYLKILALIVAIVLIVGLASFANSLNGNPVSKMLAKRTGEKYISQTYAGTDYYIDRISYNFKDGNYHIFVKSQTSIDTEFTLIITMLGEFCYDTYEDVVDGFNTARRIEMEYRVLVDTVFESPTFPYRSDITYGTLEIYPEDALKNPEINEIPSYALNQNELVLDKIYDVRALGKQAGHLIVYVDNHRVTFEDAAEMMLDIKKIFDDAAVPFVAMDFVLQYPRPEEGRRPEGEVRVENFSYDDIYEEGMVERVQRAHEALDEYYKEMDEIKKESLYS